MPTQHVAVNLEKLRKTLAPGPVAILTHHNPDPDALAAGDGMAYLLESLWQLEVRRVYSGLVARAENAAMLKHLTPEWQGIESIEEIGEADRIVLVDTQPGAGNNLLPETRLPAAVFDHHQPIRSWTEKVPYRDLRPEIGASVTLVFQHLEVSRLPIPPRLATALFYGLKTDTHGLSRGASTEDEKAYIQLLGMVDRNALMKVEYTKKPAVYFNELAVGLVNAIVHGSAVVANLRDMHRPDFAADVADQLIRLESARAVLCMGRYRDLLQLSVRTVPLWQDAGLLIQQVVEGVGRGGGHGEMAGGQIPITDQQPNTLEKLLVERFLKMMGEEKTPGNRLLDTDLFAPGEHRGPISAA